MLEKLLNLLVPKKYYVFRRYAMIQNFVSSDFNEVREQFALHFVPAFRTRKAAQKAIDQAKIIQPWQEFIILS